MKCKDCKHYLPLKRRYGKRDGYGLCLASGEHHYRPILSSERCFPLEQGWIKPEDL